MWNRLFGFTNKKSLMANKTAEEKKEPKERTTSPEKESKMETEQSPSGTKPLAAKSGYYYAHNQVLTLQLCESHWPCFPIANRDA